jgi:hypothetical protein
LLNRRIERIHIGVTSPTWMLETERSRSHIGLPGSALAKRSKMARLCLGFQRFAEIALRRQHIAPRARTFGIVRGLDRKLGHWLVRLFWSSALLSARAAGCATNRF